MLARQSVQLRRFGLGGGTEGRQKAKERLASCSLCVAQCVRATMEVMAKMRSHRRVLQTLYATCPHHSAARYQRGLDRDPRQGGRDLMEPVSTDIRSACSHITNFQARPCRHRCCRVAVHLALPLGQNSCKLLHRPFGSLPKACHPSSCDKMVSAHGGCIILCAVRLRHIGSHTAALLCFVCAAQADSGNQGVPADRAPEGRAVCEDQEDSRPD